MELVIRPFPALPCRLEVFIINGRNAELEDFGNEEDHDIESAEPYACGDMWFEPKLPTTEVLQRFNITADEYNTICRELEKKLFVGECGLCI